jgi:hypothetical protein
MAEMATAIKQKACKADARSRSRKKKQKERTVRTKQKILKGAVSFRAFASSRLRGIKFRDNEHRREVFESMSDAYAQLKESNCSHYQELLRLGSIRDTGRPLVTFSR